MKTNNRTIAVVRASSLYAIAWLEMAVWAASHAKHVVHVLNSHGYDARGARDGGGEVSLQGDF